MIIVLVNQTKQSSLYPIKDNITQWLHKKVGQVRRGRQVRQARQGRQVRQMRQVRQVRLGTHN